MIRAYGYVLSDRWQECRLLMRPVRDLWCRLEIEAAASEPAFAVL